MTIEEWLSGERDYETGVQLYAGCRSFKPNLLRNFRKRENSKNREKLVYELKKYAERHSDVDFTVVSQTTKKPKTKPSEPKKETPLSYMDNLPKEMRPVREMAHTTHIKRCRLKANLNECAPGNEKEAFAIQLKLYRLLRENELCWEKIHFYLDTGKLPPSGDKFSEMTSAQLVKREQLKHQSISKAEKKIKNDKKKLKEEASELVRARIEKSLAKTERNLLKHKEELITIQKLINGK